MPGSILATPSALNVSTANTITLVGTQTAWNGGTTFSFQTDNTGSAISNIAVSNASHATLTLTTSAVSGEMVIWDNGAVRSNLITSVHPPALQSNQVVGTGLATDGEGNPQGGIVFNFQLMSDGDTDGISGSAATFSATSASNGYFTANFVTGWKYKGARGSFGNGVVTFTAPAANFTLPSLIGAP